MILRLLLLTAAILIAISWFQRHFSPHAAERAARRRKAFRTALRQTAFTIGAVAFLGIAAFAGWHALRFEDSTAGLLALLAVPVGGALALLARRAGRS